MTYLVEMGYMLIHLTKYLIIAYLLSYPWLSNVDNMIVEMVNHLLCSS